MRRFESDGWLVAIVGQSFAEHRRILGFECLRSLRRGFRLVSALSAMRSSDEQWGEEEYVWKIGRIDADEEFGRVLSGTMGVYVDHTLQKAKLAGFDETRRDTSVSILIYFPIGGTFDSET